MNVCDVLVIVKILFSATVALLQHISDRILYFNI